MYARYAIYFLPDGVWGQAGATWLGWDCRSRTEIAPRSDWQGRLADRPRKYGFHATVKAPFRMAEGQTEDALRTALERLCAQLRPIPLPSLQLEKIGAFHAFTAPGEHAEIGACAARAVEELDSFRAPLTEAELARRRTSSLTAAQDAAMLRWGYPYVMEFYRFHMTLTGPVREGPSPVSALEDWFAAASRTPLSLDSLSLAGERPDGKFEQISRVPLAP